MHKIRTSFIHGMALSFLGLLLIVGDLNSQTFSRNASSVTRQKEQQAASLARLGHTEQAVDIYLELLYKNPKNSNIYFRITNLMPGKEFAPTLLQILDDLLQSQSKNIRLAADRGRLLYLLDKKEEALSDWNRLILVKDDRYTYTAITNAMLQAGATDEAIKILLDGRTRLNEPDAFAYDLARIYASKFEYASAGHEYLSHLDQNPAMLDHISIQLISLLDNDGAFEIIQQSFDEILGTSGNHQAVILARAKLLLHEKRYDQCVETLLASKLQNSIKSVLGIANDLSAEEAWTQAAELYLYISAHSTDKRQIGEALLKLASTYEHRLHNKSAYQSLASYFEGNQFLKLDYQVNIGDDVSLAQTLKLYDSLQTLLPRTKEAFEASFHIAEIQLKVSGDVDRAIRGYLNIFENTRDEKLRLTSGKRLVDSWLVKGDTTAALKALQTTINTLDMDEDDTEIIVSRIKIFIHRSDLPALKKELLNLSGSASPVSAIYNDGLELSALIEANGAENDPAFIEYLKAEKLIGQHKLFEAIDALLEIKGGATSIADEANVRAIQLLLALDKSERAVTIMDSFLEKFPDSNWRANVLIWRGEYLQFSNKNPDEAIPYYEEVIINHPGYLGVQELRIRLRHLIGTGS